MRRSQYSPTVQQDTAYKINERQGDLILIEEEKPLDVMQYAIENLSTPLKNDFGKRSTSS